MKKTSKTSSSRRNSSSTESPDLQQMAQEVIKYIETHAKKLDKATLAKYAGIAVLVIYGLRKSNVLGSLALSLITGLVTKYVSEQMDGASTKARK
jgi:hypothetical protein